MKLRLPHKLQTALLAAVASVSFTTVSTATLGAAAAWAFFSGHAGAEDLTHDPILTQQLDHAKKIEFGKLSLSETGAEQVENNVAKSSFGSGDVAHLAAAATLGGDIVDAVLCEGYSEADGSWQADAAALFAALDSAATSEFGNAVGLATVDSGEPVFSTTTAAAPAAAATSSLDLAPQQDNSYNATTAAASTTAASGSTVSAPSVGGGAGAVSVGGATGSTGSVSRPVVMKTAGVTLQTESAGNTPTQDSVSVNMQDSVGEEDALTRQEVAPQPRLVADMAGSRGKTTQSTKAGDVTYNGLVFTMRTDTSNAFATRKFTQATYENGAWVDGTDIYSSSNTVIPTPLGQGVFWTMYCSTSDVSNGLDYGNTLRLAATNAEVKLTTDFTDFTIGGLIAETSTYGSQGSPAYWFYRGGSMNIDGANDVNMDIKADVRFSYGGGVNVMQGGTWKIAAGETLEFDNNSYQTATTFKLFEGKSLTVTGGGSLLLGRIKNGTYNTSLEAGTALTVTGNSTVIVNADGGTFTGKGDIRVESGSKLQILLASELSKTIYNEGTVQFASGKTVTLPSLDGFEKENTAYSANDGRDGYATRCVKVVRGGTIIDLASVTCNGTTYSVEDGAFSYQDNTAYYLNTVGSSLNLSEEMGQNTALANVIVNGTDTILSVSDTRSLSGITLGSGTGLTMGGTGSLSLETLVMGSGSSLVLNIADNDTLRSVLTKATGTGTIHLGADATLVDAGGNNTDEMHFAGVLDVGSHTLNIGNYHRGDTGNEPKVSSLSEILLSGGTVNLDGWGCQRVYSPIHVTGQDSTLNIVKQGHAANDAFGFRGAYLDGAGLLVTSQSDGTDRSQSLGQIKFDGITGTGTLYVGSENTRPVRLELGSWSFENNAFNGNVVVAANGILVIPGLSSNKFSGSGRVETASTVSDSTGSFSGLSASEKFSGTLLLKRDAGNHSYGLTLSNFDGTLELQGRIDISSSNLDSAGKIVLNTAGVSNTTGFWSHDSAKTLNQNMEVVGGGTAELFLGADVTVTGALTGDGTLKKSSGSRLTLAGDFSGYQGAYNLNGGVLEFTVEEGLSRSISNSFSGGNTLRKSGAGGLTVTSSGVSIGNLDVTGGKLSFDSAVNLTGTITVANADGQSGILELNGGATVNGNVSARYGDIVVGGTTEFKGSLDISCTGNSSTATIKVKDSGSLRIGGGSNLAGSVTLAGALEANGASTISGSVSGAGRLTKTGDGTLELRGNNSSYTGAITVSAGTLVAGNAQALGSGAVAVNGGTLDLSSLTSTVSTGALSVAQGATLALGSTALTASSLSLATGATLDLSHIAYGSATEPITLVNSADITLNSGVNLTGLASGWENASLKAENGALTLVNADVPPTPVVAANSLGRVMYIGDSITDGVTGMKSWRYEFFKILADEGIGQVEEGYFQSIQSSKAVTTATYGGRLFTNTHSAQASARSYETAGVAGVSGGKYGRYGNSNLKNWLGQSDVMTNGAGYSGAVYSGDAAPDTYFMLLGTNDLLSDYGGTLTNANLNTVLKNMFGYVDGTYTDNGTFDKMLASMKEASPDGQLIVLDMPTWYGYREGDGAHADQGDFDKMVVFNQRLREWANRQTGMDIRVVDVNTGMIDVADAKTNTGVRSMYIKDGLHPSAQGELIMAGNVAHALGYGGRTAGQARKAASEFTDMGISLSGAGTSAAMWESKGITITGSFTVDISSLSIGDGGVAGDTSTWDTSNVFALTVGNGSQYGTLNVNEAYIKWGDNILYSYDMSKNADSLRISYITGADTPDSGAGYYVWLGDMLIGQALTGTAGGSTNGVSATWTGSTAVTLGSITGTAGAYAPSLGAGHYENTKALYLVAGGDAIIPWKTKEQVAKNGLNLTASGTYNARANATASTGVAGTDAYMTVTGGSNVAALYANQGNYEGSVYLEVSGVTMKDASGKYGWIAAHNTNTLKGNASVVVENTGSGNSMLFGVVSGIVDGNVYTQVNGGTFATFTNNGPAYSAAYQSKITGLAELVVTAGTFANDIMGGICNGNNTIGSALLDLRGGSYQSVFGGGSSGTISDTAGVSLSGGTVRSNVYGGGTGGTIGGASTVTVTGGTVQSNVYGGGTGGTITGDATVEIAGGVVRGSVYGGGTGGTMNSGAAVVIGAAKNDNAAVQGNVYAGGTGGTITGDATVEIAGGLVKGNVYAGGTGGTITGNAIVTLSGGLVYGDVYGACSGGTVQGSSKVVLHDGAAVKGSIYGGADQTQAGRVEFEKMTGYRSAGLVFADTIAFTGESSGSYAADLVARTVEVTGSSSVSLNQLTLTACALNVEEGSSLTLEDSLVLGGVTTYRGNVTLAAGLMVDVDGDALDSLFGSNVHDVKAPESGNGFLSGEMVLLKLENGYTGTLTCDATKLVAGPDVQDFAPHAVFSVKDDTSLVLSIPAGDAVYLVRNGTVVYGDTEASSIGDAKHILIEPASGTATLELSQSLASGVNVTTEAGSVIKLDKDVVLKASSVDAVHDVTLVSDDEKDPLHVARFVLDANAATLPQHIVLDQNGWTGAVQVSGSATNFYFTNLATANSWVEVKGLTGFPQTWAADVSGFGHTTTNLILTNPSESASAFVFTAGSSAAIPYIARFSGKMAGTGTFEIKTDKNNGQNFEFTGDISAWTGDIKHTSAGNNKVTFYGQATEVNAALNRNGNKLALGVGKAGQPAGSFAFAKTVDVLTTDVVAGNTATFHDTAALGTVSGAGNLVMDAGDKVMSLAGNSFTGSLTLDAGTLDFTREMKGLSSLTLGNETTIKLFGADKLAATGAITVGEGVTFDLANFNAVNLMAGSTVTLATGSSVSIGDALEYEIINWTAPEGYRGLISADATHLYLTVAELAHELIWQDATGTWGARDAWYNKDGDRVTFQDGDDVTINAPYDSVAISVIANATADTMTVEKGDGQDRAYVEVSDTVGSNTISVETLQMKDDTGMTAKTRLEVHKTLEMGELTYLALDSQEDATIAAAVSGGEDATITKQGDNSLTLTGDNSSYGGVIVVSSGTLVAAAEHALGSGTVAVDGGAQLTLGTKSGIYAGSLSLEGGSTLAFIGDSRLTLGYDSEDNGTLTLGSGVNFDLRKYGFGTENTRTLIDAVTLGEGTSLDSVQFLLPTYISEAHLSYDDAKDSIILTFTQAPTHTLYWKGGLGDWTTGTDTKVWHPSETTAELTYFVEGDNVIFDNRSSSSSVSVIDQDIIAGTVTVNNGTRVILQNGVNDATLTAREIDVQGALNTHINIDAETVKLGAKGVWTVVGNNDRTFSGDLAGTGTLVKTGSGELVLSGDNAAFSGTINLAEGIIVAHSANALGTGSTVILGGATELQGTSVLHIDGNSFTANAGDAATISASLSVLEGSSAFFAGDGNIEVTGSVVGRGGLVKDGFGTLSLGGDLTYTGNTQVKQGSLVLGKAYGMAGDFAVDIGASLTLAGAYVAGANPSQQPESGLYVAGTFTLDDGSILDLSHVTFTDGIAELVNAKKLDMVKTDVSWGGGTVSHMVEGVVLQNLRLPETEYARLMYKTEGTGADAREVLYLTTLTDDNGYYWNGSSANGYGTWEPGSDSSCWHNSAGKAVAYRTSSQAPHAAYFLKLDGVDNVVEVTMADDIGNVGDVVFGANSKYHFVNPDGSIGSLGQDTGSLAGLILRKGAQVEFDMSFGQGDGSYFLVDDGASLVVDSLKGWYPDASLYNGENYGSVKLAGMMSTLKHVTNFKDLDVFAYMAEEEYGDLQVGTIYNAKGATATFSSSWLHALLVPQKNQIENDGLAVFKTPDEVDMSVGLPIVGSGEVRTEGAHIVVFSYSHARNIETHEPYPVYGTVEAGTLDMAAATTIFRFKTDISDKTTLESGKKAYMYGGANLADLVLEESTAESATEFHVGPEHIIVDFDDDGNAIYDGYRTMDYVADSMVSRTGSELYVDKGAKMTVGSINAGTTSNIGNVTVGTGYGDASDSLPASLTVSGAANVHTVTMHSGTAEIAGNAYINQIMQDGGTLTLQANSVLDGVTETRGGKEVLTGGTVTGGELALGENVTLDQNAVVDVRTATGAESATYTVSGGSGSKIDASDLELIVDRTSTLYREIVRGGTTISGRETQTQSGFMSSGDEYVKLFDMGAGTGLKSNNEAVYHSQASGMMTLIGTDNWAEIKESIGQSTFDVEGHIGYGYLHTSTLGLETYYVRDIYTALDGTENKVTLDSVFKASMDGTTQKELLGKVVFDVTDYNKALTDGYNGTLTVDRDTSVDLFAVTTYTANDGTTKATVAAINITDGTTVKANEDSAGVQGTLHLEGAGVYEITNRNDLGTGISLRGEAEGKPEWDGTVRVTGTSSNLSIEKLSVGNGADASTIEFKHWNGALKGGEHTSDAKVLLTGTAIKFVDGKLEPAAMTLTGADGIAYTFTNTVTGEDARVRHNAATEGGAAGNVVLTFEGDTSDWNGIYEQTTATRDKLTFTGGETVNAGVLVSQGHMDLTYGGTVTTVNSAVTVYKGDEGDSSATVNYTGGTMEVAGALYTDKDSVLTLNVGPADTEGKKTVATFTGAFTGTQNSVMNVNTDSTANINTEAELLRVVGDTGSNVGIGTGHKLVLTGKEPTGEDATYSEFHGLDNQGTIDMQANGGDIRLVVDDGVTDPTYKVGALELTGEKGTAAIGTSASDEMVTVEITNLKSENAGETLQLTNRDGSGTVNYELGGKTEFDGTIEFGSAGEAGNTNVVLESDDVAASAVLKSTGNSRGTAYVVVNTANAGVLGITSADDASVVGKVYGTPAEGSEDNRQVTITGSDTYSYNGGLGEKLDIAYTGNGKQTFEGGAAGFSGSVTVDNGTRDAGVLEVLNAASMNITDLTIGSNNTLVVKQGENVGSADANVTVSGTLLAKGGSTTSGTGNASRMDANLTLASGSTLNVAAAGGTGGLDLGGSLTINTGALLSEGDIATLLGLEIGSKYDLAFSVGGVNFSDVAVDETGKIDASTYFTNLGKDEYYICYTGVGTAGGNGSNVGTVYLFKNAPEPTTGTLSLLALAALCARRRRKA